VRVVGLRLREHVHGFYLYYRPALTVTVGLQTASAVGAGLVLATIVSWMFDMTTEVSQLRYVILRHWDNTAKVCHIDLAPELCGLRTQLLADSNPQQLRPADPQRCLILYFNLDSIASTYVLRRYIHVMVDH